MKYLSNKNGNFVVVDGKSYRVQHQYYNDAEEVAPQLLESMFDMLGNRKNGMTIVTVGDVRFVVGSFPNGDTGDHAVQLSEVRTDDSGIKFKKTIPFLKGTGHIPIIALTGSQGEVSVNAMFGPSNLGSVAQILQQGINETLHQNGEATPSS